MRFGRPSVVVAALSLLLVPLIAVSQDKFFDSQGVRIRYVEQGAGTAIVLIHGDGNTLQSWIDSGVLPDLAKNYRVIAFDARGSGMSAKPHDVKAYGREMGMDVIRLLDHLRIQKAHVIGYSMGAHITAQLMTMHPGALHYGHARRRCRQMALGRRAERSRGAGSVGGERECVSRSQIYRLAPTNAPKPDEEAIKRLSAACMANPNEDRFARAARTRAQKDQLITPAQIARVTVPTLAIVGNLDRYLSDFNELKKMRQDIKLVVIDQATHGGPRGAAFALSSFGRFESFLRRIEQSQKRPNALH